jgi:cyclase
LLAFRLIARLDIRNSHLIKTIRCEGVRKVGDPAEFARRYDQAGIDEILYLDVVASLYGRNSLAGLVERSTADTFVPVTVGGGIASVDSAGQLLRAGADKVAVNTSVVHDPALITKLAHKFGSQAIVLQLDAKWVDNDWEAYCEGGRQPTGRFASPWAAEAVDRGAGEILVTSIDREGVRSGFDVALIEALSSLSVPVVAAGGFGAPSHAVEAYEAGASGVAIAGDLHYGRTSLKEIRGALRKAGVAVR